MNAARLPEPVYPLAEAASYWIESTTSTMDEARLLAPASDFGIVIAGSQRSGRGRLPGRSWVSEPGASLLATLWFPAAAFGQAPLPMIAGLAVARAAAAWARGAIGGERGLVGRLALKWPNDVLLDDRKLAGILCEGSAGIVYAGIGINCRQSSFEGDYRTRPTSLYLATGSSPELLEIAALLARAFEDLRAEPRAWKAEYERLLAWKGRLVVFREGLEGPERKAVLRGVDDAGALLLAEGGPRDGYAGDGYAGDAQGTVRAYHSGEIKPLIDDKPEP